jgi:hypothetical protein
MARKHTQLEGQQPLLTVTPGREYQSPTIKTWKDIADSPEDRLTALSSGESGPSIDKTERAAALISALNALAHRNMLVGFDEASLHREYKKPIWERYLDGTPKVIDSSQSKAERLLDEAQEDFWRATGFAALSGSGISRGQVRTQVNRMWRSFTHDFGDPKVHGELVAFRKAQRKLLPEDHPLQSVKGWRNTRRNRPVAQKIAIQAAESKPAHSATIYPELPKRTPEIDQEHLKQAGAILDRLRSGQAS